MNNEVIKAMNKQPRKVSNFEKWWRKNRYIVMRIIFFPIWAYVWLVSEKIRPWLNSRNKWNETRTDEILNYYIPRCAEWNNEKKTFYLFDNAYGWHMHRKYIKLKDRRFWELYTGWCGGKIRDYLLEYFELEGFTKEIGNCYDGFTEVTFTIK